MDEETMTRALILCPSSLMKSHLVASMKGVSFIERTDEAHDPQVILLTADYVDFMAHRPDYERYSGKPWVIVGDRPNHKLEAELNEMGIMARFLETKTETADIESVIKKVAGLKRVLVN